MSNMKRSKKVSQEDLRRLMAQHKGKTPAVASKIDNPLAKYNDSGQLTCALCKSVVRSESVWPVHINSRQHRDSVDEAKRLKELTNNFTSVAKAPKRSASPPVGFTEQKKIKGILKNVAPKGVPDDFFQKPKPPPPQNVAPSIVMSHNEEIKRAPWKPLAPKMKEVQQDSQPPTQEEESKAAAGAAAPHAADQPIPEGFFDDPVLDAKARNIEYKDPIEEEWERFQKEMREETSASAEIIAGEQEEATAERQIDEIDEQIRNWSRVLDLELKKEETSKIKQEHGDTAAETEGDASGSDADIDEFLDWRAKKSYS